MRERIGRGEYEYVSCMDGGGKMEMKWCHQMEGVDLEGNRNDAYHIIQRFIVRILSAVAFCPPF